MSGLSDPLAVQAVPNLLSHPPTLVIIRAGHHFVAIFRRVGGHDRDQPVLGVPGELLLQKADAAAAAEELDKRVEVEAVYDAVAVHVGVQAVAVGILGVIVIAILQREREAINVEPVDDAVAVHIARDEAVDQVAVGVALESLRRACVALLIGTA
ncbi:MAG: hypothetical protein KKB50_06710 [Planctomycetes bacterium]|nr:hypothetical protein [Planctomycetota bacterium]